jgi:hypothetical protein
LKVFASTVSGNASGGGGGGIYDDASNGVTVNGSLVFNNATAGDGGGIRGGNLVLVQSTVVNNSAEGDGGGVWVNGQLDSINSTFVGNVADSKGAGGKTGGGVYLELANAPNPAATGFLSNTLVIGNLLGTAGATTPSDIGGTAAQAGSSNNLIGDAVSAGGLTNGTNGNIVGKNLAAVVATDPDDNGTGGRGPQTLALVPTGPAVNAGNDALAVVDPQSTTKLTNDARDFPFLRVVGGKVDIGAFEVQNTAPVITLPTTKDKIAEDSPAGYTFSGAGKTFRFTDDALGTPSYTVTLTSPKNKLTLGTTAGLTNVTGNGTGTVSFKAATAALANAALDGLKFVAGADVYGTDAAIKLTVDDGNATAPGGAKSTELSGGVTVTPVADAPTVTSPTTPVNTPVEVVLTRNPADGEEITHFKVTNVVGGTLTYLGPLSAGNVPSAVVAGADTFYAGSFFDLKPVKETKFTFTPTPGFQGVASFDIQVGIGVYGDPLPGKTNPTPVYGAAITSKIAVGTVAPPADTTAPTAKLGATPAVTAAGTATYEFAVTYADNVAVNAATFDGGDVRVTGPNGFSALASFVKADAAGNGTPRVVTYRVAGPAGGFANGTYTVASVADQVLDTAGNKVAAGTLGTFAVTVTAPAKTLVGYQQFAVGGDAGSNGQVQLLNADRSVRFTATPFAGFTGGVRTAAADFNGDGVADLVAGTGPGRATRVVVLDGVTQRELFATDPFEAAFQGGVFVAAGDVTGDGVADLVITPDEGGGPRVKVISGAGFKVVADFFGIDDPNFRGGARAAVGDINGDGVGDLVVVAGFGGGPRVAAFNGKTLTGTPAKLFGDFFAFETALRNGVYVTVGDITGDGKAELIAGGGPGGGPRVTAFDGAALMANQQVKKADFLAGDAANRGGVRVAVKDLDKDATADLVVGSGVGAGSKVTGYLDSALLAGGNIPESFGFDAIANFKGGVYVG